LYVHIPFQALEESEREVESGWTEGPVVDRRNWERAYRCSWEALPLIERIQDQMVRLRVLAARLVESQRRVTESERSRDQVALSLSHYVECMGQVGIVAAVAGEGPNTLSPRDGILRRKGYVHDKSMDSTHGGVQCPGCGGTWGYRWGYSAPGVDPDPVKGLYMGGEGQYTGGEFLFPPGGGGGGGAGPA
jgi:hypothetical protein